MTTTNAQAFSISRSQNLQARNSIELTARVILVGEIMGSYGLAGKTKTACMKPRAGTLEFLSMNTRKAKYFSSPIPMNFDPYSSCRSSPHLPILCIKVSVYYLTYGTYPKEVFSDAARKTALTFFLDQLTLFVIIKILVKRLTPCQN
jgi:hypothetical protein